MPLPIHLGVSAPNSEPIPDGYWTGMPLEPRPGAQVRTSPLETTVIDWDQHGVEPRWQGMETADCVAALLPGGSADASRNEFERLREGARGRGEPLLIVSMLGYEYDDAPRSMFNVFGMFDDTVMFPQGIFGVRGRRLPTGGPRPSLSSGLTAADRDLGTRLLNRPKDAPWWTLSLLDPTEMASEPARGQALPRLNAEFKSILVDGLGNPLVAVLIARDEAWRWYIVPDAIIWDTVVDWLVQQAIPAFVPHAPRRFRLAGHDVGTAWRTRAELAAQAALADMEIRHSTERAQLEADLKDAGQAATLVRDGLLHGAGDELVQAVEQVLDDAGLSPTNLDRSEKGTWSADLLVGLGSRKQLVEVKAVSGTASESLVGDLLRHLDTWRSAKPDLPVEGGTLIVNHQRRRQPEERERTIYNRPELVKANTVRVVSTLDLFDWWKDSNWSAIQQAVLGCPVAAPPPPPSTVTASEEDVAAESSPRGILRWLGLSGRSA
ncbi:hypothetical protein G7043_39895 [Lentzea sp. NEAU-D13]|uniref:Uncharacterized protein n=1 Tax=Lentzea alba TaxID=2714351 RepID=A0A7C9VVL7_9PSEU|nr:hypothetical protein [Lentzea alba]NGY65093.1 hypothetical protein [Lentzea alba]